MVQVASSLRVPEVSRDILKILLNELMNGIRLFCTATLKEKKFLFLKILHFR